MRISRRMMLAGLLAGAAFPAAAEVMESSPRPVARGGKATVVPAFSSPEPRAKSFASAIQAPSSAATAPSAARASKSTAARRSWSTKPGD